MEQNKWKKIYDIIGYIYFYAILGWIVETIWCFLVAGLLEKRGYLYATMCPIYGFGAIILLSVLSNKYIGDSKIKKFLASAIICSIFEFLVAVILEVTFAIQLWDYSSHLLNLDGKISVISSVTWGILGVVLIDYLQPFVKKQINKIDGKRYRIIISIMLCATTVDFILSTMKYLNF